MNEALMSIIILSYNNLQYYKECLQSIFMQDYPNIEIILSDDGSIDSNLYEISQFIDANKGTNISSIVLNSNNINLGIVKNYNKAIQLSRGKYIFYLGIDDMLFDKTTISDVVKFFETTGYLIFTGYREVYDQDMKKRIKTLPRQLEVNFLKKNNPQYLFEKLCISNFIAGSCTPFAKKLIDKYGYIDESYNMLEDYPRYLKITKNGCNIGFLDRKLIKYRLGGVTTNGKINKIYERDYELTKTNETKEFFVNEWNIDMLNGRRIIVWGTGDCYQKSKELHDFNIEYFIDSNKDLQGKLFEGKKILAPSSLLAENKNSIFILIFSYANYYEISEWLLNQGFIEKVNYYCCSPQILKIIKTL